MKKKFLVVALMAALSTVGYAYDTVWESTADKPAIPNIADINNNFTAVQNDVNSLAGKIESNTNALAGKADADKVYSKTEVDEKLSNKADNSTIKEINANLAGKADADNVYSKTEVDEKLSNKVSKEELGNALANKADKTDLDQKVDKNTFNKNNAIISGEIGKVDQKAEEAHNRIDKVVEVNKNQTADINKNKADIKDLGTKLDNEVIRQDYKNKVQDQRLDKVEETNKKQDAEIAKKADKDYVDAENKKQDAEIEKFQGQMDRYDGRLSGLEKKVDHLDDKMNKGLSLMAAMNAVDFQNVQTGEMALGAGIGHYGNAQSVALGVAYSPVEDLTVNAKYSVTAGDVDSFALGAGATYKFKIGR